MSGLIDESYIIISASACHLLQCHTLGNLWNTPLYTCLQNESEKANNVWYYYKNNFNLTDPMKGLWDPWSKTLKCTDFEELSRVNLYKNPPASAGDTGSSPGLGKSHMLRSNWAREPQLLSPRATTTEARVPRVHAPQLEVTAMRSPRTATKSSLHLLQLEKDRAQQRGPNVVKAKINKLKKKKSEPVKSQSAFRKLVDNKWEMNHFLRLKIMNMSSEKQHNLMVSGITLFLESNHRGSSPGSAMAAWTSYWISLGLRVIIRVKCVNIPKHLEYWLAHNQH